MTQADKLLLLSGICLAGFLAPTPTWAAAAAAGGCFGEAGETTCQYVVPTSSKAPEPSHSRGIYFPGGTSNVLFNSSDYPTLGPYFVDNTSSHDFFVPQGEARQFKSFLLAHLSGFSIIQGVLPGLYIVPPTYDFSTYWIEAEGGPMLNKSGDAPASVTVAVPQASLWTTCGTGETDIPCTVARVGTTPAHTISVQCNGWAQNALGTCGGAQLNSAIQYLYNRYDCPSGVTGTSTCTLWKIRETQVITFTPESGNLPETVDADGTKGSWVKTDVKSTWEKSMDGTHWTSIKGPTASYTLNLCMSGTSTKYDNRGNWIDSAHNTYTTMYNVNIANTYGCSDLSLWIPSNCAIGSNSTGTPALVTGNLSACSTPPSINILNDGYIVGHGGDAIAGSGGPALQVTAPITIDNYGVIGGGGGSGSSNYTSQYGGYASTGGGGAGLPVGVSPSMGSAHPCQWGPGTLTLGGASHGCGDGASPGGNLGQSIYSHGLGGTDHYGGTGYAGGSAGYAISGMSFITWGATGTIAGSTN